MPDEKRYSEIEYEHWEEFTKVCIMRLDAMWLNKTCNLTDDHCRIDKCFVFQVVKLIRGYF